MSGFWLGVVTTLAIAFVFEFAIRLWRLGTTETRYYGTKGAAVAAFIAFVFGLLANLLYLGVIG